MSIAATFKFFALFLLTVSVFNLSDAAVLMRQSRSTCPEVTTKPDFDYIPYAGLWYEIERFESVFQEGSTCERAIYEELSPGVVRVFNTAMLADGSLYTIDGTATPISADQPGYLIVTFPGRPEGTYLVLDTDYTSYGSVYSCKQAGAFALEYAWIIGREQTMEQSVLDLALSKFTQFGINVTNFQFTPQGAGCIYYPEYPFVPRH